jgi:hypothetical protein
MESQFNIFFHYILQLHLKVWKANLTVFVYYILQLTSLHKYEEELSQINTEAVRKSSVQDVPTVSY